MWDNIRLLNPLISRLHLTIYKSSYFTASAFSIHFKYQCSLQVRRGNRDKVKVSVSLIAVGAVGARVPLYLGHS